MEQRRSKYIVIVMLFFSVITPTTAAVIYNSHFNKKMLYLPQWPGIVGEIFSASENPRPKVNNSSAVFEDSPDSRSSFEPELPLSAVSVNLTEPLVTSENPNTLPSMWLTPSDNLWLTETNPILFYKDVSFKSSYFASGIPSYSPDTLGLRFWRSIIDHQDNWDQLLEKNASLAGEPAPEPEQIGFLGASIMSLTALRQYRKK